jgi:isopenicillin-N N-acyltransferase-like protein
MTVVVELFGSPFERGVGQAAACPGSIDAVRHAVEKRLSPVRDNLRDPRVASLLAKLRAYLGERDPDGLQELNGIAEGFGIRVDDLFAYLHLTVITDISLADGCSSWAVRHPQYGALVGKNRDFRGEHLRLQHVFRHSDPAWGGRTVTCVGSLGSPAAYSSGINSDGLALVDTAVRTTDHGSGLLRYFLMTRLLVRCGDVAEALAEIACLDHAGGGTLVLADRSGALAAVELGHTAVAVEAETEGWVARTNHFVSRELRGANLYETHNVAVATSEARLAHLRSWLGERRAAPTIADAQAVMASHDGPAVTGLCRHGHGGDSRTISGALFATARPTLYFCPAKPCSAEWREVDAKQALERCE